MTTVALAHRLYLLLGIGLLGLGLFVLAHPSLTRGGSLVLLGIAVLERRFRPVRRWLASIDTALDDTSDLPTAGRRVFTPRRPNRPLTLARTHTRSPFAPSR